MFTSRKEHHPKPFFEINDLNVIDYYASEEKLAHPADEAYRDLIRGFKRQMCRERENEKRREKRKNTQSEQIE